MSVARLSSTCLLGFALFASACGGGTDAEEATSAPAETSSTTTTAPEPTTTTLPPAPTDPAELAEFVQLRLEDFPPGHDLETEPNQDPICDGVTKMNVAFPPAAETSTQVTSDHFHAADVAVYEDVESAEEAYEYMLSGLAECSFSWLTDDEDGSQALVAIERFAPQQVAGVDRLTGFTFLLTDSSFGIEGEMNVGLRGPLVFRTMSSDPTVVPQLSETVTARAAGDDSAATIEPEGSLELLPGLRSPEYWSWPDGPALIRESLDLFSPAAAAWIEAATDERLNEMASDACVAAWAITDEPDLAADDPVLIVLTETEKAGLSSEVFGELFQGALDAYCPGLLDDFFTSEG